MCSSRTHSLLPEPDDFSDIDPAAIREALAERGIINGEVVDPEKLNRDPFIQRVMADVGQTPQADVFQSNTPADLSADYQLLSRLKADCDYYLGAGGRSDKHLWADSADEQIAKMRELYDKLPDKPEWLTAQQLDEYARRMVTPSERDVFEGNSPMERAELAMSDPIRDVFDGTHERKRAERRGAYR